MDHTFGHQEIFDSLSQGSGSSRKSNASGNSRRVKPGRSLGGSAAGSVASSNFVDEAYRRQGKRLSYLAHGEETPPPPVIIEIHASSSTAFGEYKEPRGSPPSSTTRRSSLSVLKRLIFEAKYSFRKWEDVERLAIKSGRDGSSRRQRKDVDDPQGVTGSLREMGLQEKGEDWDKIPEGGFKSWRGTRTRSGNLGDSKGLLSAVLESQSDSNTSTSGPTGPRADRSTHTSPSQSISTKDSKTFSTSVGEGTGGTGTAGNGSASGGTGETGSGTGGSVSAAPAPTPRPTTPPRGKCLTVPSQAVSNTGLDNVEGNLILFENDALTVPRRSIHTFGPKEKSKKKATTTFRVQKLLGQGTFAQVFQCLNERTDELVAVKIVKSKPAYTRQATVEIDVFRALQEDRKKAPEDSTSDEGPPENATDYMVNMNCYFMYQSHLCLVFQLLGLNLYEVLKRRQFRGMPLTVVQSIVKQSLRGIKELSQRSIVHCDLKPENILVASEEVVNEIIQAGESQPKTRVARSESDSGGQSSVSSNTLPSEASRADTIHATNRVPGIESLDRGVKLIDFGSACFEGYTAHTYIQSRFYRSPEVVLGLPYDSAIDMWSLGCVAAELLLGLPILPGVHEHDQLSRIEEMIAKTPDWMLEQGTKAHKYYLKFVARPPTATSPSGDSGGGVTPAPTPTPPLPQWRMKTQEEYVKSLSKSDIEKKGGLAKLDKPPGNRYFRKKALSEVLKLHSCNVSEEEKQLLNAFTHFLHGLLDPDPWKRWTAFQAVQHPFITGQLTQLKKKTPDTVLDPKETNLANLVLDHYWKSPWDPAICRRKLLNVQKMREKQQAMRRTLTARSPASDLSRWTKATEPSSSTNQSSMRLPVQSTSSPPGQLDSSAGQHRRATGGKVVDATPPFVPSSNEGRASGRPNFADGSVTASMRSRTDDSGYESGQQFIDADFAYALQRPGVVPASSVAGSYTGSYAGSYAGSYSSQAGSISSHNAPASLSDYVVNTRPSMLPQEHGGRRSPQSFAGMGYQDQGSYGDVGGYAASATQVGRDSSRMLRRGSSQYSSSAASSVASSSVASSAASSVTADTGMYSSGYENSQGQMMQQMGMFPQQGIQPMQIQGGNFGMPQGAQMGMQQAPVVTQVQAPDGGFYFVMTSPTGQTMLLQPVASTNQPQPMQMYGGQVHGVAQGQQTQSGQYTPQQGMQFQPQGQMQQGQSGMQQGQGQLGMQQGQMGMQQSQMGISQGHMFQGGVPFAGGGMNPQGQFQPQQQQQFFQQPQMQQQSQFQSQQQYFQPLVQQPQQYGSGHQHDSSSRRSRSSARSSGRYRHG